MEYLKIKNKEGFLLLIDFEKAFDSVSWGYITECLQAYNFGPKLINWYHTLYYNAESCVINNGHFSDFFHLRRGCRQGDPLSSYIFILAIEPLGMELKNNPHIRGIQIGQTEVMLGQYADDTFLLLKNDERSLRAALETFRKFYICSGLRINMEKTKAVWIGSKAFSEDKLCPEMKLTWETSFILLGIKFNVRMQNLLEENLNTKVNDIKKILVHYEKRNLSILGKVTVIKTFVIPKLIHVLSILANDSNTLINDIQKIIAKFVWNNGSSKIAMLQLAQQYENGGLKLTHIPSLLQALRISWVARINGSTGQWQDVAKVILKEDNLELIWNLDEYSLKLLCKKIENPFWREVLQAWRLYKTCSRNESTLNLSLWNTYFIKNENLLQAKNYLVGKGCKFIKNIISSNGTFLTFDEFKNKYDCNINYLDYLGLLSSIPKKWKDDINAQDRTFSENEIIPAKCNIIYWKIVNNSNLIQTKLRKWEESLNITFTETEKKCMFTRPLETTIESGLRAFQFKLLHRILSTNKYLEIWKIKKSNLCTFCETQVETIEHLFWDCPTVCAFWQELSLCLWPYLDITDIISRKNVLFGVDTHSNSTMLNHIFLIVKKYIFAQKCKEDNLKVYHFIQVLRNYYISEIEMAKRYNNKRKGSILDKWKPLKHLLDN
jgi:hypothetical protein